MKRMIRQRVFKQLTKVHVLSGDDEEDGIRRSDERPGVFKQLIQLTYALETDEEVE
jgi:hypothetical protein